MRELKVRPGKYIAAISGGVDSVVLADILSSQSGVEVVVAHVDHGIRTDSHEDAVVVRELAERYGFLYEVTHAHLGPGASEDEAREARHRWLREMKQKYAADAILTAHHRDDLIETMLINLVRGTGWRGLASLRDTSEYQRPLSGLSKAEVVEYAIERGLKWREDSTNNDLRYLRNYIRHGAAARLTVEDRKALTRITTDQIQLRKKIEEELDMLAMISTDKGRVFRYWLTMLPEEVANELLIHTFGPMTRPQRIRLLHFARTGRTGAKLTLDGGRLFRVTVTQLIVSTPEG